MSRTSNGLSFSLAETSADADVDVDFAAAAADPDTTIITTTTTTTTADSVASVPLSHVRRLRVDLENTCTSPSKLKRTAPARGVDKCQKASDSREEENRSDDNTDTHNTSAVSSAALSLPAAAPLSRPPPPQPPRFLTSKSAMAALPSAPPSQDAIFNMARAASFHYFPGGDTQPMESQVYRDFTTSMLAPPALETPRRDLHHRDGEGAGRNMNHHADTCNMAETEDTNATDKTPQTCAEDDTGFIDITNGFRPPAPSSPSEHEIDPIDDLLADASQIGDAPGPFSSVVKMPKTPAMAGRKHGRNGELLTSAATATTATKTPGYSRFFPAPDGQHPDLLSATQLFQQTQAPSSPMPDVPLSDPVVTRPSPNIGTAHHLPISSPMPDLPFSGPAVTRPSPNVGSTHHLPISSPTMTTSSPFAAVQHRPSSSRAAGPRDGYTTMRESQQQQRQWVEQRATHLRKEIGLQARIGDDELEDRKARPATARPRISRTMSDDAANGSMGSRARSRFATEPAPPMFINIVTPATTARGRGERVEFDSSDESESDENMLLDGEYMHENGGRDGVDDDEYDELGQTVLRSQPARSGPDDDGLISEIDDEKLCSEDGVVGKHAKLTNHQRKDFHNSDEQYVSQHAGQPSPTIPSAGPFMAVADSQASRLEPMDSFDTPLAAVASPMTSFVPGSQYTGKTSHGRQTKAKSPRGEERLIPSSPPSMPADIDLPVDSTHQAASARAKFAADKMPDRADLSSIQEVPESDIAMRDVAEQAVTGQTTNVALSRESSGSMSLFTTAQTRLSNAAPRQDNIGASPLKKLVSQLDTDSSQSPRRAAGVRHFSEIAATSSPFITNMDSQLDIDAILSDVITADDERHMDVVASPTRQQRPRKRRQLMRATSEHVVVVPTNGPSNINTAQSETADIPADVTSKIQDGPHQDRPQAQEESDQTPASALHPLRSSPRKTNDLKAATTPTRKATHESVTPESVRKREQAGANAVSQFLAKRSKGSSKIANSLAEKAKKRRSASAKHNTKATKKPSAPHTTALPMSTSRYQGGAENESLELPEQLLPSSSRQPDPILEDDGMHGRRVQQPVSKASRVFAIFRGVNNYYPATWLAATPDGKSHRVQFDDGTTVSVETHHICNLDLQLDDAIKVDVPGMRTKTWLVAAFGETKDDMRNADMHGHVSVKVRSRAARTSLPAGATDSPIESDEVEVPVSSIYLPPTMWRAFEGRRFVPPIPRTNIIVGRAATPSTGTPSVDCDTPSSRTRRAVLAQAGALSINTTLQRDKSVASTTSVHENRMFSNMAFAISYGSNEAEKAEVANLIVQSGGFILDKGFDELFELPDLDNPDSKNVDSSTTETMGPLLSNCLKPEFAGLGFVALIADHHSRREKYMQALALGLPTLSGKWIYDSLAATTTTSARDAQHSPLAWSKYLLAAGESAFLGGAVRSRILTPYDANGASLESSIRSRTLLLDGARVLIVVPKKSKAILERRKAYAFLTRALGAGHVRRVADLAEAREILVNLDRDHDAQGWGWVYVDGDLTDACAALEGATSNTSRRTSHELKSKKKPSTVKDGTRHPGTDDDGRYAVRAAIVAGNKVRVVNDEFVVQSLILGALAE